MCIKNSYNLRDKKQLPAPPKQNCETNCPIKNWVKTLNRNFLQRCALDTPMTNEHAETHFASLVTKEIQMQTIMKLAMMVHICQGCGIVGCMSSRLASTSSKSLSQKQKPKWVEQISENGFPWKKCVLWLTVVWFLSGLAYCTSR